jgi:integrase
LRWQQVRFGTTTYLDLNGKGRKERSVPLWPKTAKVLQKWQQRQAGSRAPAIFPSLRGNVRTRGFLPAVANFVALLIFVCTR